MKAKVTALLMAAVLVFSLAGCSSKGDNTESTAPQGTQQSTDKGTAAEEETTTLLGGTSPSEITADREGNPITLPETIERVMIAGPSNGEILAGLGLAGKIIAADIYSSNIEGLNPEIPLFDMASPDVEQIVSLKPDVIFVTGMVLSAGDDPYKPFKEAGICIIYIPSSTSIEGIKEDIKFIANVMGVPDQGTELVNNMEKEIADIKAIGDTITEKKKVYFEIAAAPSMYSFGTGVFLNEMMELVGAENILADSESWMSVADEAILSKNPDVILTCVNYLDDPIGEIKARPGWDALTAVKNDAVYSIDTDASNNPSQNIVKALKEMAKAIYPDQY